MNGMTILRSSILAMIFGVLSLGAGADEDTEFFIDEALMKSSVAIANAKMALDQSNSQEVKAYAQRIINDNESLSKGLTDLAKSKKVTLAKADEVTARTKPLLLQVNTGEFFDVAYANNQVVAHQQTLLLFQNAMQATDADSDVINFVRRNLTTLEQHHQMAQQLVAATAETRTDIYQDRDGKTYDTHQHLQDMGGSTAPSENP